MKPYKTKKHKCRECKQPFERYRSTQIVCGLDCAKKLARKKMEKEEKADLKKRKAALNHNVPFWIKKVQTEFNKWVRGRDHDKPCISCGKTVVKELYTGGKWDCGHYKTIGGFPELRFEPLNAHKQCKYCNNRLSGNVTEYRKGLIVRIGIKNLEWVERSHDRKYYRVPDLKDLHERYKLLNKKLKAGK